MEFGEDDLSVYFSVVFIMGAIIFMAGMASNMQASAVKAFFWDTDLRRCKCSGPIIAGLMTQILANPIGGGVVISLFPGVDKRMRVAAMMIMCSSGGMGSNLMAYISYGNFEASVVLSACSTLLTAVTFPTAAFLSIEVIWRLDDEGSGFPPQAFLVSVVIFTIPIGLGLLLQRVYRPKTLRRFGAIGLIAGVACVVVSASIYLTDEQARESLRELGSPEVFLLAFVLNGLGLLKGYAVGYLCGFSEEYRRTLMFEVGAQNLSLPLGVIATTFPTEEQPVYVTMLAAYSITQSSLSLPLGFALRLLRPLPEVIERRARALEACAPAAAASAEPPGGASSEGAHAEETARGLEEVGLEEVAAEKGA